MKTKIAAILTVASLLCTVQAQADDQKALRKQWLEALRPCLVDVKHAIIIDLPQDFLGEVPKITESKRPMELWGRYATLLSRELVTSSNGLFLKRKESTIFYNGQQLIDAFSKLPAQQLQKIAAEGIRLSDLPFEIQENLVSNFALFQGLSYRYLNGDPILIKLLEVPVATPTDSNRFQPLGQYVNRFTDFPKELSVPTAPTATQKRLPSSSKDGFFFGEGRVVSISELANEIRRELKVQLIFDTRLKDCLLYVQGRLPKEQLLSAMSNLVKTQDLKIHESANAELGAFNKLMQAIDSKTDLNSWNGMTGVDRGMLDRKKEYTVDELTRLSPFIQKTAAKELSPDARFKLDMFLGVSFVSEPSASRRGQQFDCKIFIRRPTP